MPELIERVEDRLADFTRDKRVLTLSWMAVIVGALSAVIAYILVWLIAVITNIAFYRAILLRVQSPDHHRLGYFVILVPVVGGLIIGLMARYGSEKIRGHGIPEALEAILLGRSRMEPKVAVLKPFSSAISIGTGGPFGAEGPIIMTGGAFGLDLRAVFSSLGGGTQNAARRRRRRRHVGGLRLADRGGVAGGRAAAFRMAAAQLSFRSPSPRSWPAVLRVPLARRRTDLSRPAARGLLAIVRIFGRSSSALLAGLGSGLADAISSTSAKIFSSSCRFTGCGGRRSARLFVGIGGLVRSARARRRLRHDLMDLLQRHILGLAALLGFSSARRSSGRSR